MNNIFSRKTKNESDNYDTMSSLSHTKWNCKYHIVFTPKFSIEIYGNIKGQKQPHNFPEVVKFEVQIWPAKFLVPWLLCRHGR